MAQLALAVKGDWSMGVHVFLFRSAWPISRMSKPRQSPSRGNGTQTLAERFLFTFCSNSDTPARAGCCLANASFYAPGK